MLSFLNNEYKEIIKQEFGSTAAAAKRVAENPEKKYAAIANLYAAKFYNLKVLHSNIQDFEQNHTKFIVISKKDESLKLSKNKTAEKTSLILQCQKITLVDSPSAFCFRLAQNEPYQN
jgi:prephenate dehydratase